MLNLAPYTTKNTRRSRTLADGEKIRVLIVDDSVVVRRLITHALAEDRELEVVGTASTAESALLKLPLLKPDLVTLDINMPGMSGLDLLPILCGSYPDMHVLMVSTLTVNGATSTLDALMLGASDYVSKPAEDHSLGSSLVKLQSELLPKIKALFRQRGGAAPQPERDLTSSRIPVPSPAQSPPLSSARKSRRGECQILAVGVSTGGPNALATFMAGFPLTFPLPIVIVQHMPPVFTGLLADRLRALTGFNVVEATSGMLLEPGKAIIAPGDFHMRVKRIGTQVAIALDQGPQECSCRPSVDVLFRSVSQVFGAAAVGTVLTGMGQDGLRGAEHMKRAGAYMIAQDEASSVVWGMPGAIAQAGFADEVLDLKLIPTAIQKRTGI